MTTPTVHHQYAPEDELTKLNNVLQAFIGKVSKGDDLDGELLRDAIIKESKVYKELEAELIIETEKKIALEEEKKKLKLRAESAEDNLKSQKTVNQTALMKEKGNRREIKTLKEENKLLKEFNEKEINELRHQMQESEVQINVYKSGWMKEIDSLRMEYKGIIARAEAHLKEENKILMERMNKMKMQHQESTVRYETTINKLTTNITSQQEEIKINMSSIDDLQKAKRDLDKEIANYRKLLEEGFQKIAQPLPDSLGNPSQKPNLDGNTKTPNKDQNQGKPKSSDVLNPLTK